MKSKTKAAKFNGQPKTRQVFGQFLNPGQIVIAESAIVEALCLLPDFETVDTTADREHIAKGMICEYVDEPAKPKKARGE